MPEPTSPEATLFTRIARSGLLERVIPPLIAALIGGSAGMASHQVEDADHVAAEQAMRTKVLELEGSLAKYKADELERQRLSRERADREHAALESEQRREDRYLERRLTRIETKLGIEAPPAAAEAPAEPPQ